MLELFCSHFCVCFGSAHTSELTPTLQKAHLNLCIFTVLCGTHLDAISSKTISPRGIATLQFLHYAKQSNQSGRCMYCMQVPAVVTEIALHFYIHIFVYLLRALAAGLHWCQACI